jgi:hypothetical protein
MWIEKILKVFGYLVVGIGIVILTGYYGLGTAVIALACNWVLDEMF